jgi:hypothetical protein
MTIKQSNCYSCYLHLLVFQSIHKTPEVKPSLVPGQEGTIYFMMMGRKILPLLTTVTTTVAVLLPGSVSGPVVVMLAVFVNIVATVRLGFTRPVIVITPP